MQFGVRRGNSKNSFSLFCSESCPPCITHSNIHYMKNFLLFALSMSLCFVGCYEDLDNTPPTQEIIEISEVFIQTRINGSVKNISDEALSNYELHINGETYPISKNQFDLELTNLKKKGQTIHVHKDGKQIGILTHLFVENDINRLEILSHDAYQETTITSSNPTLAMNTNLEVDFSGTSWENGYDQLVNVEYTPIHTDIALTPVGFSGDADLLAIDSKGGFYLKTKDVDGKSIEATDDSPIIIRTANLDPDINSLFVFDELEERWILVEEFNAGAQLKIKGKGYYSFAHYSSGVYVEGRVIKEGKPVAYQPMDWELGTQSNVFNATESGQWIALLPEREDVEVHLLNPCNESLQQETLSIDVEDLKNQDLEIQDNVNYQQLDVEILDCDGERIETPSLSISSGGNQDNYIFSEGYSNRWIAVCNEFDIAALNIETGNAGPTLPWSIEITSDLDVITDCDEYAEGYSYFKIRDDEKVYEAFELINDGDRTILQSTTGNIKLIFRGQNTGTYDVDEVNIFINDESFEPSGYFIKCEDSNLGCGINNFNVTHFASGNNGMVRATFSGTLWMQTLNPMVAGNFEIEGVIVIRL